MMNRRNFLTTLLGSAAALPLLSSMDLTAAPSTRFIPPSVAPPRFTDYEAVHQRALELFNDARESLHIPTKYITSERKMLGDVMFAGVLVKHQCSVSCDYERPDCLEAAMQSLAERCARVGLDSFARLAEDLPGTAYARNRGELRMVVQYLVQDDLTAVRFDAIGGVSPQGECVARRYSQDSLKRVIRRRLGTYPAASRLV